MTHNSLHPYSTIQVKLDQYVGPTTNVIYLIYTVSGKKYTFVYIFITSADNVGF